jgi:hypothetical protein
MISYRPVRNFLVFDITLLVLLAGLYVARPSSQQLIDSKREIARRLLLTDYCFSTESRHTRHISMPEWFAPFQDVPGFHDHFPSSSFIHPTVWPAWSSDTVNVD